MKVVKVALLAFTPFLLSVACSPAVKNTGFPQILGSSSQSSTLATSYGVPLYVNPQVPVVNDQSNSIPLFAGGGQPPYVYRVVTANGGYFSENLFTSTTVSGPIQATVTDAKGKVFSFTINVIPTN